MKYSIVILGIVLTITGAGLGATIYVPSDQPTIQAAIEAVGEDDTVAVLPGSYPEKIDFLGKAVFVGSEEGPEVTIIDGGGAGSVVSFTAGEGVGSVLDGFTIRNGHAVWGGGIYCYEASPTVVGNIISGNTGVSKGGGIYCYSSSSLISGNTISDNQAGSFSGNTSYGGGICCWNSSSPVIAGNTISGNKAGYYSGDDGCGGGIACWNASSPLVAGNIISGNEAEQYGGGIYCLLNSNPDVTNNTLYGNAADMGGGFFIESSSEPVLLNTILWFNSASIGPEGYIGSYSILTVSYSDVDGGEYSIHVTPGAALDWGSGMIDADPLFADPANGHFDLQAASPCIDAGDPNSPPDPDGSRADMGAFCYDHGSAHFALSVSPDPLQPGLDGIFGVTDGSPNESAYLYYSLEGTGSTFIPHLDVTLDLEVPELAAGPTDADSSGAVSWTLPVPEPAAGKEIWFQAAQFGQATNVASVLVARLPVTWHVPDDFETIQDAIDASADRDSIIVRPGTYPENINFSGKAVVLRSEQGAGVTFIDGGQLEGVVMFNSGEGPGSVLEGFTVVNGSGYWWYGAYDSYSGGITCLSASPTITGNTITGNSYETGSGYGGGIYLDDASPALKDNIITGNSAGNGGGIAFRYGSSPEISGNTITLNAITYTGGGIYCDFASGGVVTGNIISDNTADWWGGGIMSYDSTPLISGNVVSGNSTVGDGGGICCVELYAGIRYPVISGNIITGNDAGYGGGIYCSRYDMLPITGNIIKENFASGPYGSGGGIYLSSGCGAVLTDNIIADNTATLEGGGISLVIDCDVLITNNTITANQAAQSGGGIYLYYNCTASVANTILWDNYAGSGNEIDAHVSSSAIVSYSDVEGGWPGTGNINADPLLAAPSAGDFHLPADSPCKDAGSNSASGIPAEDFEGDPRIHDGTADMGADEFHLHLYSTGTVTPGGTIEIAVVGEPFTSPVELGLGSGILDPPKPTPCGDLYLAEPIEQFTLGAIPANGVLVRRVSVPSGWQPGEQYHFQALAGPFAPGSKLTNLMTLTVE